MDGGEWGVARALAPVLVAAPRIAAMGGDQPHDDGDNDDGSDNNGQSPHIHDGQLLAQKPTAAGWQTYRVYSSPASIMHPR